MLQVWTGRIRFTSFLSLARVAWYQLDFRTDILDHARYPSCVIQSILCASHHVVNLEVIFSFLWNISKAKDDLLFNKKFGILCRFTMLGKKYQLQVLKTFFDKEEELQLILPCLIKSQVQRHLWTLLLTLPRLRVWPPLQCFSNIHPLDIPFSFKQWHWMWPLSCRRKLLNYT